MRRHFGIVLFVITAPLPRLAAQWSIAAEIGVARFHGNSRDTSGSGDSIALRPYRPTTFSVRLGREAGRVRFGIDLLYGEPGLAAEGGGVAFVDYDGSSLLEFAPDFSCRVTSAGEAGQLRLEAGPAFDVWSVRNGVTRTRPGAHAAVTWEWPVTKGLTGSLRVGAVLSGSVFRNGELPAALERRASWRGGVSAGLRYGF